MSRYRSGDEPVPGYKLVSYIGQGSFGEVWNAIGPGQIDVALKFLNLDSKQGLKELRALGLVKKLRHPHLVPIHAIWLRDAHGNVMTDSPGSEGESESVRINLGGSKELVIAMGLGDQSLAQVIADSRERVPLRSLVRYMEGAAKAIDYLNEPIHPPGNSAIIHCDIKPANLLLVGREVQVCDYGVARALSVDMRKTLGAGTPAYAPPELINNEPSPQTDQYSLAISYFELRTGQLPFDEAKALYANLTGNLDLSLLTDEEQQVIRRATSLQPGNRYPTALDMVEDLKIATGISVIRSGNISWPARRPVPEPVSNPRSTPRMTPPLPAKRTEVLPPPAKPVITPQSRETTHSRDPGTATYESLQENPKSQAPSELGTIRFEAPRTKPAKKEVVDTVGSAWKKTTLSEDLPPKPAQSATATRNKLVPILGGLVGLLVLAGIGIAIVVATRKGPETVKDNPGKTNSAKSEPIVIPHDAPKSLPAVEPKTTSEAVKPEPPPPAHKGIDDLRAFKINSPENFPQFAMLVEEIKKGNEAKRPEFAPLLAEKLASYCLIWDDRPLPEFKTFAVDAGREQILVAIEASEKNAPQPDPNRQLRPFARIDIAKAIRWEDATDSLLAAAGLAETDPARVRCEFAKLLARWSDENGKADDLQQLLDRFRKRNPSGDSRSLNSRQQGQFALIEAGLATDPKSKKDWYRKAFKLFPIKLSSTVAERDPIVRAMLFAASDLWLLPGKSIELANLFDTEVVYWLTKAAELSPEHLFEIEQPKLLDKGKQAALFSAFCGLACDIWSLNHPTRAVEQQSIETATKYYTSANSSTDDSRLAFCIKLLRARLLAEPRELEKPDADLWLMKSADSDAMAVPYTLLTQAVEEVQQAIKTGENDSTIPKRDAATTGFLLALMKSEQYARLKPLKDPNFSKPLTKPQRTLLTEVNMLLDQAIALEPTAPFAGIASAYQFVNLLDAFPRAGKLADKSDEWNDNLFVVEIVMRAVDALAEAGKNLRLHAILPTGLREQFDNLKKLTEQEDSLKLLTKWLEKGSGMFSEDGKERDKFLKSKIVLTKVECGLSLKTDKPSETEILYAIQLARKSLAGATILTPGDKVRLERQIERIRSRTQ